MNARERFGLPANATADEVRGHWRRRAMKLHPDRGGDKHQFDEVHKQYRRALAEANEPVYCDQCGGTGRLKHQQGFYSTSVVCTRCGGTGRLTT